jgi:adenylate kinase family enzyme
MRRVSIVGNSGSGKSTIGRALAAKLGVPYVELDAIFHQPNWVELPVDEFRARVSEAAAGDGWVIDGNYNAVRLLVWERADTVVWLDYERSVVMRQVVTRTFRRAVRREELWNGNREPFRNFFRWKPEESIIRWSWTQHAKYVNRYASAMDDPEWSHLEFVRLSTRQAVAAFLEGLDHQ